LLFFCLSCNLSLLIFLLSLLLFTFRSKYHFLVEKVHKSSDRWDDTHQVKSFSWSTHLVNVHKTNFNSWLSSLVSWGLSIQIFVDIVNLKKHWILRICVFQLLNLSRSGAHTHTIILSERNINQVCVWFFWRFKCLGFEFIFLQFSNLSRSDILIAVDKHSSVDFRQQHILIISGNFWLRSSFWTLSSLSGCMLVYVFIIHVFILWIERSYVNQAWLQFLSLFLFSFFPLSNFFWRQLWSCFRRSYFCLLTLSDILNDCISLNKVLKIAHHYNAHQKEDCRLFHT